MVSFGYCYFPILEIVVVVVTEFSCRNRREMVACAVNSRQEFRLLKPVLLYSLEYFCNIYNALYFIRIKLIRTLRLRIAEV